MSWENSALAEFVTLMTIYILTMTKNQVGSYQKQTGSPLKIAIHTMGDEVYH